MEEKNHNKKKLIIHPKFRKTLEEIKSVRILTPQGENVKDFFSDYYVTSGKLKEIEEKNVLLNSKNGAEFLNSNIRIAAYDESINKYTALEGTGMITSHTLTLLEDNEYIPLSMLTFYFYTRAKKQFENMENIRIITENEEDASKVDYLMDRNQMLAENCPENTILFIDGSIFSGLSNAYNVKLNKKLLEKNIIPIYIVKNSFSNMVVQNSEYADHYNSDLHWVYNNVKVGERTKFFKYDDLSNPEFSKIFCYFKPFKFSPIRIEMHSETYSKYKESINEIMDLIYYQIITNGSERTPQCRIISISEEYSRETISMFKLEHIMKIVGATPTINQERFAW